MTHPTLRVSETLTTDVLLVQGAGDGAHAEDQALADYLRSALADGYRLHYPRFDGLEAVNHEQWKRQFATVLPQLGDGVVIVGHSLGGAAVLKYLAEEAPAIAVAGLFLVATPYKARDGDWAGDDFALDAAFASSLPPMGPVTLYHSTDDEWVPFEHQQRWAEKLGHARVRSFADRSHSFTARPFTELVDDIRSLRARLAT